MSLPSIELANVMVSYMCWENNVPNLWKFLEKAMVYNMVPSMLVLALLSSRSVFPFSIFFWMSMVAFSWRLEHKHAWIGVTGLFRVDDSSLQLIDFTWSS